MELQEFVEQAISQICVGISNAKKKMGTAKGSGWSIPKIGEGEKQNISFEISLYVSSANNADIKGGLKTNYLLEVTGLKGDVAGSIENYKRNDLIQKISFQVPYSPKLL